MNNQNIHENVFLRSTPELKKINSNLTEEDILYLQNTFLINGYHHIEFQNILSCREIITKVLFSLNYYKNIACLTTLDLNKELKVLNIFNELETNKNWQNNLSEFLLESKFFFDFLWIEESQSLINSEWYKNFRQLFFDFNIDLNIPIIVCKC